ncbi:putative serine/threonine-protein kinase iks1 [Mortierella sp. AD011]|nr:putative serine/threonine-protein kinase iks1 [Mortierella sp. AD010]KAF9402318.1 putative serine/threonine-protein kinase iks1 [Mortierella sp. AD011]
MKDGRPTFKDNTSSSAIDGTSLQDYRWSQNSLSPDQRLLQYRESVLDGGHESDPSELLRSPVLFTGSPPNNNYLSSTHDMYPLGRPNRSMSLSMGTNVWNERGIRRAPPTLPPPPSGSEVVPYSQEWRVILRSQPQGRTVLYNPQMQSLVVQTTVGLDSHPVSLRDDPRLCRSCRRRLDLDEPVDEEDISNSSSAYMDSNYFRMLADANMALSGRGSLQEGVGSPLQTQSPLGSPTSSSRTSLDLDSRVPLHSSSSSSNLRSHPLSPHLSHDALNQGYYERFFMEQKKLGRGYRGSVFLCQHVLDGIHLGEYAIKKVAVGDNHDWLVQMLREVHLLERLHHPNIVSYKHAWLENHQLHKFGPEVTCLFILMECANGGNLEEYVEQPPEVKPAEPDSFVTPGVVELEAETVKPQSARERLQSKRQRLQGALSSSAGKSGESEQASAQPRHHLSITEIWGFFFDICEGLAHLHHLGIIHRDLKPPNLLLSYTNGQVKGANGERPRILITDFGECEILDQAAKRDRTGATGTLEFLAPELLAVDTEGRYTNEFSFKGDMWSLGMVLYYLCYSRLPYSQIEDVDILRTEIRQFKSITIPEDGPDRVIPEELKILIRVLLSPEKSKRPSCDDILKTLSHQRERMMRGDMDSATTPIQASTDLGYGESEPTGKAKEIDGSDGGDATHLSAKRQVTSIKSSSNRQPHRQNYHPVRQNSLKAPMRRQSRATLISENSSKVSTGHGQASLTAMVRNAASPSINLHKKVKPLGLGLRHMLRRKMNHPAVAADGVGIRRYSSCNDDNRGYKPILDLIAPKATYPLALESSIRTLSSSPTDSISKRSSPTQVDVAIAQHQDFQDRRQAAHGKESALGSTMELASECEPGSSKSDAMDESKPPTSNKHDLAMGDQISNTPDSKKSRHDGQGQSFEAAPLHEALNSEDSFADSSTTNNRRINHVINNSANGGLENSGPHPVEEGTTVAQSRPVLGKTYWTKLASAHAKSNSNIATPATTDATGGAIDADESSEDDDYMPPGAGVGVGLRRRHTRTRSRTSLDKDRADHSQGIRSTTRQSSRQSSRRNSRQMSIDQKSLQQLQLYRHQLQEQRSQHFLPEDFSFLFMFVSLIIRIWFCLRICNPVMVRPIVLYPVLILTAVWDRYLISLVLEKIKASSSMRSGAKHQRGFGGIVGALGINEGVGATASLSTPEATQEHSSPRKRTFGKISSSRNGIKDADNEDTGLDADAETDVHSEGGGGGRGRRGSLMMERREHDLDQHIKRSTPIWQAFVSGVLLQLLWIGAIWLFSRDGLCIM